MMTLRQAELSHSSQVRHVMILILTLNLCVSLAKIVCGTMFNSDAVRADGIHSIFDCASNAVVLAGVTIAARPADESHPYGHGKYEAFASMLIGVLLLVAAFEVGGGAMNELVSGEYTAQASPVSFAVMVGTLAVNIFATTYERRSSVRLNSSILAADSKHTLSDALVSGSVILGLVLVAFGYPIADAIASLVVTVAIIAAAFSVFKDVHDTFSDERRIAAHDIAQSVLEIDDVHACHRIRTRGLAEEVYADLHILVDPQLTILDAHRIGDAVEEHVKTSFPQVKEVLVHIEPDVPEERVGGGSALATVQGEQGEEFSRLR